MVPAENEGNLIATQESVSSWKVPQKITAGSVKSSILNGVPNRNDSVDWGNSKGENVR